MRSPEKPRAGSRESRASHEDGANHVRQQLTRTTDGDERLEIIVSDQEQIWGAIARIEETARRHRRPQMWSMKTQVEAQRLKASHEEVIVGWPKSTETWHTPKNRDDNIAWMIEQAGLPEW